MSEGIDHDLTRRYLDRRVDARMVALIDHARSCAARPRPPGPTTGVLRAPVSRLGALADRVDVVFCSELVEHVPGPELRATLDALEAVAAHKVVITVPNRLFPHAHLDPTHVLRYRLGGLLGELNRGGRFAYSLHPLGFAEHWARRSWCRPLDAVARRVAVCSPTVLYLGRATG
jgi:hypothetical protein